MAKRFTDTDKFDKRWYRTLPVAFKVAWDYLYHKCNHAGIISLDRELANFQIGEDIDWDDFIARCEGRVIQLASGKLFLADFIAFQYGELSDDCKPHKPVIKELKKHGLLKGYPKGIDTLKEKEKEQEQEKEQEKERGTGGKPKFTPPTVAQVAEYVATRETKIDPQAFCDFYASKGWKVGNQSMKDWRAAVRTWERNDTRGSPNGKPARRQSAAEIMGLTNEPN